MSSFHICFFAVAKLLFFFQTTKNLSLFVMSEMTENRKNMQKTA